MSGEAADQWKRRKVGPRRSPATWRRGRAGQRLGHGRELAADEPAEAGRSGRGDSQAVRGAAMATAAAEGGLEAGSRRSDGRSDGGTSPRPRPHPLRVVVDDFFFIDESFARDLPL